MAANGAGIPNYGKVNVRTVDEQNNQRMLRGSVSEVHKPLGSAAEMSKNHDVMLWEEGGVLIPKNGPIALGLRYEYKRLMREHGGGTGILPIYREGALYNFYLKPVGPVEVASFEQGASHFMRQAHTVP